MATPTYKEITMIKGNGLLLISITLFPQISTALDNNEALSLNCNGCHGPNGISAGQSIPSIAGLNARYFMRTMMRFRKGERDSTIMDRISKGYKISELRKISDYFSSLDWINAKADIDQNLVTRGHEIHKELCEECHENNGRHQDKEIPRISGQAGNYLYLQMKDYYNGSPAMPQPDKMKDRMATLDLKDLEALSHFYSSGK
ncbi:MAG: cytochrome c, class I [Sedimenticola sp.]